MNDALAALLSLGAGALARLLFLPAGAVRRRWGAVAGFAADFVLSALGGVPFALLIFLCRDGAQSLFTLAGFYLGLLAPSLFLPGNKAESRRETDSLPRRERRIFKLPKRRTKKSYGKR